MVTAIRVCRALLIAALTVWACCAPLVWILRDGLGPDSVGTTGAQAAGKFAVGWGLPALVLAVPLAGLWLIERRLTRGATG